MDSSTTSAADMHQQLVESHDVILAVHDGSDADATRTRNELIVQVASTFIDKLPSPISSPRTANFAALHRKATGSLALLSSADLSLEVASKNVSKYVESRRSGLDAGTVHGATAKTSTAACVASTPAKKTAATAAPATPSAASAVSVVKSSPPSLLLQGCSLSSPAFAPSRADASSSTPPPELCRYHPDCPSVPLPQDGPFACDVRGSDLSYDGVTYASSSVFSGPHARDDAVEFGLGPDFLDKGCRSKLKHSADNRLIKSFAVYQCRHPNCDKTKALGSFAGGGYVVHSSGDCSHVTGSYAFNAKDGGKDGLPPSIRRFVDSYISNKLAGPLASVDDIKPEETTMNICTLLQSNQYFRNDFAKKQSMKKKIRNSLQNFRQSQSKKNSNPSDADGTLRTKTQLQEYSQLHELPLDHSILPFPAPKSAAQLNDQSSKLGLKPRNECELSMNSFVTLPVPIDDHISSMDKNGQIRKGIMVFTSVALLYNLALAADKYDSQTLLSMDVTHNICANHYNMCSVCIYSTHKKGGQTASPIAYSLVESESEVSAVATLLAATNALKKLWGLDVVLKIGTISDHSEGLLNALNYVFPEGEDGNGPHGNCFMHLKQKVREYAPIVFYLCLSLLPTATQL